MSGPSITTTDQLDRGQHLTILVYGPSGSGKTYMTRTSPDLEHTLLISAESGELSLDDVAVPVTTVTDLASFKSLLGWLKRADHGYTWLVVDSISEVAEMALAAALAESRDGRQAYGAMQDTMTATVKWFRDLPLNVVLLAKQAETQDESGRLLMGPSFPGKRLAAGVPYLLDVVAALRPRIDDEGNHSPYLQTRGDGQYTAKARGGRLDMYEPPDLAALAAKLTGQ